MKIDELNSNVTSAIRKVEEAEGELAHAELAIATATSPTSIEGRIARRGAIRAAKAAGLEDWVEKLLKTFLSEEGIDEKLTAELKAIANPEPRGKWFLVYTYVNTMEAGTFRDGIEDSETPLGATTEAEAIAEATAKWRKVLDEANARWQKQKTTYAHPPATAFDGATPNPRIIYKISL